MERRMLKLNLQYFGHLMCTDNSLKKIPDAGKDRGQKKKRVSEDEMAGQRHLCNGHEFGQTPGDGEGQGGLVCCSPWARKESDWLTEQQQGICPVVGLLGHMVVLFLVF